jgi:hypothetical protein
MKVVLFFFVASMVVDLVSKQFESPPESKPSIKTPPSEHNHGDHHHKNDFDTEYAHYVDDEEASVV